MRCSCVRVFLFFAFGALREVTLSRAPLRRPVCPIPEGSHSPHRPDDCLQIPSLALPAMLTSSLIMSSALWTADLCSRSQCSSTLLPGVMSSTRQVTNPACCWIVKKISHILKPHATELTLPRLLQGLSSSVLLQFLRKCRPVCYWFTP